MAAFKGPDTHMSLRRGLGVGQGVVSLLKRVSNG